MHSLRKLKNKLEQRIFELTAECKNLALKPFTTHQYMMVAAQIEECKVHLKWVDEEIELETYWRTL